MKIIMLSGNQNTGKTTTLKLVYDQLAQNMPSPPQAQPIQGGDYGDFESSPLRHNGKTVAIYSLGDTLYRIYEAIIKYCGTVDVFIVACSTGQNKANFNALVSYVQAYPQHCVISKTKNNDADCQGIIGNI